jgi:hypothetical protein
MMKRRLMTIALALAMVLNIQVRADEGMWVPMFFKEYIYSDMQEMGLKLTAEELYSINNTSLKDAIVGLSSGGAPEGFFCTAEIVSPNGLMFTNHHCAYRQIQSHSSVEFDYLTDGFWAMSYEEELPNEGVTASILLRMEDVSEIVFADVTDDMSDSDRQSAMRKAINKLKEENSEEGKYDVTVKPFYAGNEYYMLVYQTYRDVRLVGAPPSSIGKYGGDTDNWMWPRHTGDFTVLRIYTAPDGSPAEYAKENIPLEAAYHLPVSLKGVELEDFSMIWGFPGRTSRYLTSYGVEYNVEHFQPLIVNILERRLETMKKHMDRDPAVRIQYASTYSGLANGWKYYLGQTRGLKRLDVYGQKQEIEEEFAEWLANNPETNEKYGEVLSMLEQGYDLMAADVIPTMYLNLAGMGPASVGFASALTEMRTVLEKDRKNKEAIDEAAEKLRARAAGHYESMDYDTDVSIFANMMEMMFFNLPEPWRPAFFADVVINHGSDFYSYATEIYRNSIITTPEALEDFLDRPRLRDIDNDPLFIAQKQLRELAMKASGSFSIGQGMVSKAEKLWIAALREMHPEKVYFADANSTIRMTYGQVLDYYPADAVHYDYLTTLSGVMQKEDPGSEEFVVHPKLKELYESKDYGIYGNDGVMYVNFLTNHDITGGNSGSPVINAEGHLIGIAFDGNWEAMSGDIAFEPGLQRTISVDARYVLFIIDKFAGATHLIEEMTIIR